MFGIGGGEWVLILIIALIVFGPKKLPEIGKTLGKTLFEVKKATRDLKTTLEMDVENLERKENEPPKPDLAIAPAANQDPPAEGPAGNSEA